MCVNSTRTPTGAEFFSSSPYPNTTHLASYAALIAWVLFPQSYVYTRWRVQEIIGLKPVTGLRRITAFHILSPISNSRIEFWDMDTVGYWFFS